MPDVATRQLDIALSDIERAGFEDEVEVVGGGTFGVVDESAWTVCAQEPAAGSTIDSAPRLIVDRTCDDEKPPNDAESPAAPDDTPAGENKESDTEPKVNESLPAETFVMPPLVGANLQDAQDTLQALDSFLLTQIDATGMERFQVLDSGWKVCGQRPAAGVEVPLEKMVELFVVKLRELCP